MSFASDLWTRGNYYLVGFARFLSIIRRWASAFLSSAREKKFGKLFSWSFILVVLATVRDFLSLGITQTIAIFKGVSGDSSLLSGGNLLSWVSQSVDPIRIHAQSLFPEFWRWLGYWFGADWLVWSFVCGVILAFSGWLLSIFIKAIASVVRLAFRFV